jgi:hypothetical protein
MGIKVIRKVEIINGNPVITDNYKEVFAEVKRDIIQKLREAKKVVTQEDKEN